MRIKSLIVLGLVSILLTSCSSASLSVTTDPSGPDVRVLNANVCVDWKNFTLTNAEGQQLVMDLSETDFPVGGMHHSSEFRPVGSGSAVTLSFEIPGSASYHVTCPEQGFWFQVCKGEIGVDGYLASANGDAVTELYLSGTEVSLTGRDTDFRLYLNAGRDLLVRGHTASVVSMTQEGTTVTITGLEGEYRFWATEKYHLDNYAICGTARTGTLVIDLSRLEEHIVTITDGDEVTEHEVNKLY